MDASLLAASLTTTSPQAVHMAGSNDTPLPWVVGIVLTEEIHE